MSGVLSEFNGGILEDFFTKRLRESRPDVPLSNLQINSVSYRSEPEKFAKIIIFVLTLGPID